MRRRRRRRYSWFPILGAADPNQDGTDDFDGRAFAVPFDGSGATNAIAFPLIPDVQTDPDSAVDPTAQIQLALSTDYLIERIVGKCFVSASAPADDAPTTIAPKVILTGVGLFVARQADAQAGGGQNLPLGAATLLELLELYNPLSNDTSRAPWMWKRDWILSTGRSNPSSLALSNPFAPVVTALNLSGTIHLVTHDGAPTTNMSYGSVMDGPHVDCKVNRRVRSDERLWCIAAARSMDRLLNNDDPTTNVLGDVKGYISIRVLGALRRPTKGGSFT